MKWDYEFLKPQNFLRVTTNGPFNLEDQIQMFDEIASLEQWQASMRILFDNRRLEMKDADFETIIECVEVVENFSHKHPGCRIAGLVNDGVNFGLGRQFENITSLSRETGFRLFKDEKMAVDWLFSN